jgi:hypothetical protein
VLLMSVVKNELYLLLVEVLHFLLGWMVVYYRKKCLLKTSAGNSFTVCQLHQNSITLLIFISMQMNNGCRYGNVKLNDMQYREPMGTSRLPRGGGFYLLVVGQATGASYFPLRPSPDDLPRIRRQIHGKAKVTNHKKPINLFLIHGVGFACGSGLRQS